MKWQRNVIAEVPVLYGDAVGVDGSSLDVVFGGRVRHSPARVTRHSGWLFSELRLRRASLAGGWRPRWQVLLLLKGESALVPDSGIRNSWMGRP